MAVNSTFVRVGHTDTVPSVLEFVNVAMTGTYATGGFTTNPFAIASAGPGGGPLTGKTVLGSDWTSPLGYIYASSVSGNVMTTKIFSAPGTELANGTAVPDALAFLTLVKSKN